MKKISLKTIDSSEILTKEELKQIAGGSIGSGELGSGSGTAGTYYCTAQTGTGVTTTSANNWEPTAMNYLNAWLDFWRNIEGANPSCSFNPIYIG